MSSAYEILKEIVLIHVAEARSSWLTAIKKPEDQIDPPVK